MRQKQCRRMEQSCVNFLNCVVCPNTLKIHKSETFVNTFLQNVRKICAGGDQAARRAGRSRTIMKANTARKLKNRPRMGQSERFIPSLAALLYSHAATSNQ